MILTMVMLTSAKQRLVPKPLTAAMMVFSSLESRLVSVRPMGNGLEMHQSANVSTLLKMGSYNNTTVLCYSNDPFLTV